MSSTLAETPAVKPVNLERRRAIWWTVETIALCLWLGGLVVIGAIVAPVAFETIRQAPVLAGNTALQNQMAGAVVGGSLKILNTIAYSCFIAIWISIQAQTKLRRSMHYGQIMCLAIAICTLMYQSCALFPALYWAQKLGNMTSFDSMHRLYVNLSYAQMIALIGVAYFSNLVRARLASNE